MEDIMPFLVYD